MIKPSSLSLSARPTRQYDLDMLEELKSDGIAAAVTTIGQPTAVNFSGTNFSFQMTSLPDGYLALADIVFAQTIALLASIKVGNTPDTLRQRVPSIGWSKA